MSGIQSAGMKSNGSWSGTAVVMAAGLALVFAALPSLAQEMQPTDADIPSSQAPDFIPPAHLETEQQKTRSEIDALTQARRLAEVRMTGLRNDIDKLSDDQKALQAQLNETTRQRAVLDQSLIASEARLAELAAEEESLKVSLRARRTVLMEVLAALQRVGRNPPPALLIAPDDARSAIRSAIMLGAVVPQLREEAERLASDLDDLTTIRVSIVEERVRMNETAESLSAREADIATLLGQKAELAAAAELRLAEELRVADEIVGRTRLLEELVTELEIEIAALKASAEAARLAEIDRRRQLQERIARARSLLETAPPDENRLLSSSRFGEMKRQLSLPVSGRIIAGFGSDSGTGDRLKGLVVETEPASTVKAPMDGYVRFAGPFRSYRQMIILDAGSGYHMVLAGLERSMVSEGQYVLAGEPIGITGTTKLAGPVGLALVSDKPSLYIELWHDGKPIDSRPWWMGSESGRARNDS